MMSKGKRTTSMFYTFHYNSSDKQMLHTWFVFFEHGNLVCNMSTRHDDCRKTPSVVRVKFEPRKLHQETKKIHLKDSNNYILIS